MENNTITQQLVTLFKDWRKQLEQNGDGTNFTEDGVMFQNGIRWEDTMQKWADSTKRVMFLLKDQFQDGNPKWDEDIRYWFKDMPSDSEATAKKKASVRATLQGPMGKNFVKNLAYIFWGLNKVDKGADWWRNEVDAHFEEVKEFFLSQPWAIVECKKVPGDGNLDDNVLRHHVNTYGKLLEKEIKILNPNMIVCTAGIIYDCVLKMYPANELTIVEGHNSVRYHSKSDTLIFCSYHPSAWNVDVYDGVLTHYRAFLKTK